MFNHFPSIEGFHNVRKLNERYNFVEQMHYRAKVKLHGTNSGIIIMPDGRVLPQSRTRIINVAEDNMNFAKFVEETKSFWTTLAGKPEMTIFGEWFGEGIMKGVAASQIAGKHFAIFAIQFGKSNEEDSYILYEPEAIRKLVIDNETPNNVHVLPWYGDKIFIDFNNENNLRETVDVLNTMVETVEQEDPWIASTFNVAGTGEGLVFYPLTDNETIDRHDFANFVFKAKGEKHKTVKQKKAVQLDPEVAKSIDEFVDKVLPEARLEQGAREVARGELVFEQKLIGPFIGWIGKDVKKETQDELEESGLEWKLVSKKLAEVAKNWYTRKIEEI